MLMTDLVFLFCRSRYLLQLCTDLHHFRLVMTKKRETESAFSQQEETGLLSESDTDGKRTVSDSCRHIACYLMHSYVNS